MAKNQSDDQYSPEEAGRRRDAVVKAMIATPPAPRSTKMKQETGRKSPRVREKGKKK